MAPHETAPLEMEAVARSYALAAGAPSRTTEDPVYHVILSRRPGEAFDIEQAKLTVNSVRQSLDADRHQYFATLHHDVDTDRYHVHLAINKVWLDGRVLDRWQDYAKLGRAAEWCEREMGRQVDRHVARREKLGEREQGLMPEFEPEPAVGIAQGLDRQDGVRLWALLGNFSWMLSLFGMELCWMPLNVAAVDTQTVMLDTPSANIVVSVLNTPASQGWACRSSIRADEGALIAFPTRTNLRALDVTVSTDHDLVFLDDSGVVIGVVKHVPQTNDLGGPAPKQTSAQQLLERQYDDVSYAIILSDGRSTTAGITRSKKLSSLKLAKIGKFNPDPPCVILKK